MARRVRVERGFAHAQHIHPVDIPTGEYTVGEHNAPADGEICARAAEVALQEGWAREIEGNGEPGHQSPDSGQDQQSASSEADPVSQQETSNESGSTSEDKPKPKRKRAPKRRSRSAS